MLKLLGTLIGYLYFCFPFHAMMRLSRRLKYMVRILVWGFIGLHIGFLVLLNMPYVQGRLASLVSDELGKVMNTEVSVGRIELGLLNRILIEDVYLEDRTGKELLNVSRLSARFELAPLLKGKIVINSVQLFGLSAALTREHPDAVPNFQFVLDAFTSKDTLKEPTNIDLRINSVLLRRSKVSYDVLSVPETPGQFNASHIGVNNLTATLSLKALRNDTLNATVRRLAFEEHSGWSLKKLGLKVRANNHRLDINDLLLEFPTSAIRMDSLSVSFDSLQNLAKIGDDVRYKGKLEATLLPADFTPLLPVLRKLDEPLNFSLAFSGQGKRLEIPSLSVEEKQHFRLSGEASVQNWTAGRDMRLDAKLHDLLITTPGIDYIMNGLTGSVPSILQRLEFVQLQGDVNGPLHRLHIDALLRTAAGFVETDLLMNTTEDHTRTYSGNVTGPELNLGLLLGDKKFGPVDFNVDLKGFNYQGQYPESYIQGVVSSFEYSDYRYENITMDGIYKDGGFNGHLALDDENGSIQIDGTFNVAQAVPDFNLRASVKGFRPHELNLSDKYVDSDISLNLTADFTGNSIDDMNGRIGVNRLVLNAPDNQGYTLDSLTITAGRVDGEKELRIESSFMQALVRGDYSYRTIPASVLHTVQRYIPSLLTLSDRMPVPHNNFRFDIRVNDTELFRKLLYIPIDMQMPATLQGYFNDRKEELRMEGSFPRLLYNGTQYDSGTLLCENSANRFNCLLRGGMLMNSGAMLNFSLDAEAEKDCLKTVLNWGNNTDITYGGRLAALTRFSKTAGKSPILQADIDLLPTEVVLNDTVWNIRPSHISIDSGRVYVDNFLFERPNQYLRIDGRLTKEPDDSCRIDLKNIDVQYVLDIVRFDDVEFSGLATGTVHLKSVLHQPSVKTRLNVRQFAVNQGLMGDADIRGVWDNELGGIRLDAQIEEKGLSATHVTGYVSPKQKGLDLMIETDSTSIGMVATYLEDVFSELDGRINGYVHLFGGFKTLDFEGKVSAMLDAKVDVLNTYLQIRNDSLHIRPGEFAFNDARIYDREGNSGRVTGALRHTHLKNLNYHFNVQGDNLLMYNTDDPGDLMFYGKVYGTGTVILDGGNNALNVDVNLTTGRNTTFTYVTGLTAEAANNRFITFVDKTPKRMPDEVKTDFYHFSDAGKKKDTDGPPMDIRFNMLIDATPDASMKVIMDPVSGDHITARGNGNFQVGFYNKGDFKMFGNYIIDRGMYKLSMQEVIRKDFSLQAGSTVTFTGDPYQANLDVKAVHTVNSVSLSDLSTDASLNQSTVKVNCVMNLTGSLSGPTIKFDLELPTVSEEDRELVRSATATEEQMNTQIIYLLGIGKFYAHDYADNAGQSSNATSSLAFSTLSGQLNNMLSQVMENKSWNIGANLSTGQQGWSDVEAEAILSARLLNNRLLINGNFGYRENVMANTNFVGDFEAVWLLTRNGDFRLRGYNQTNDRYFTKSTLTTQGIGFVYKKDFDRWSELFQWLMRKQNNKKNK